MIAAFANVEQMALLLLFASVRAAAAFIVAPTFAAARVPVAIRVLAGLSVGCLGLTATLPPFPTAASVILALIPETIVGLAIGFVAQIAVSAAAMAGEMIAASMGLSFAALFDPAGAHGSTLAELFRLLGVALFFAAGGHIAMIAAIVGSYYALPPGAAWPARELLWHIALLGGESVAAGVAIALPIGVALLGLNLAAAFVTRTAPQLNMFAVAVPLTLAGGLFMLVLLFDGVGALIASAVERLSRDGLALVGG